jgi:hypothetical protein
MSRSRSSFDLSSAIATAASLSVVVPEEQPQLYRGIPLVSFGPTAAGPPTQFPPSEPPLAEAPAPEAAPAEPAPVEAAPTEAEAGVVDTPRRPPKLPDLSEINSPVVRCERIIAWIVEAVGVSDVFIADPAGLPIAGAIEDEARFAATGVVAAAVAHLAAALPGNTSGIFEMHVGEGPFFQLIGFDVGEATYVVGFQRSTPLGFRQAHAVRLACRHALDAHDGHAHGPASMEQGAET